MFNEGEYVVITSDIIGKTFLKNTVYKVRETHDFLRVVKDSVNQINNGHSAILFNTTIGKYQWRYATSYETLAYDYENKPVHIRHAKGLSIKESKKMYRVTPSGITTL